MTFKLTRPSLYQEQLHAILISDEVWNPQSFDGAIKPESFPVGDDAWAFVMLDDSEQVAAWLLFLSKGQGVYEQHSAIPEAHRDLWNVMVDNAHRAMFLETDATMIMTLCPDWLPHLVKVCARFGAKKLWHRDYLGTRDGVRYGVQATGLTVMDWVWRVHQEFAKEGHEWHEQAFAGGTPSHDDDDSHDGFVGAALAMSVEQPLKAQQVYNTWARTAGYYPLSIIWHEAGNSLIDIGNAVILNKGGKFAASIPRTWQQPL